MEGWTKMAEYLQGRMTNIEDTLSREENKVLLLSYIVEHKLRSENRMDSTSVQSLQSIRKLLKGA